jgi:hypothetical protein
MELKAQLHCIRNFGTTWRQVISFMSRPLYTWRKYLQYPFDLYWNLCVSHSRAHNSSHSYNFKHTDLCPSSRFHQEAMPSAAIAYECSHLLRVRVRDISDIYRYALIRKLRHFPPTSGIHTPMGNVNIITQNFSSVRLLHNVWCASPCTLPYIQFNIKPDNIRTCVQNHVSLTSHDFIG